MQVVSNLHQRGLHVSVHLAQATGGLHGQSQVGARARAARSLLICNVALGLLALEFALRTRARGGFRAAPVALRLFAERRAVGLRGNARRPAFSRSADSLTLGALVLLAHVLGAANRALRLLAVHRALRAGRLLALHLTFGAERRRTTRYEGCSVVGSAERDGGDGVANEGKVPPGVPLAVRRPRLPGPVPPSVRPPQV